MSKGIVGAIVGIIAAVSGAVSGTAEDHDKYARGRDLTDRADTERTINTGNSVNSNTPSGPTK